MVARKRLTATTARDLMTRDVASVRPDLSLAELATFLEDRGINAALVRDDHERAVGVVSVSDIASLETLAGMSPDVPPKRSAFYLQSWEDDFDEVDIDAIRIEQTETTVGDIMTPYVLRVAAEASVSEIAGTMLEHHVHRVFVSDDGEIVGLISTIDLLDLLVEQGDA